MLCPYCGSPVAIRSKNLHYCKKCVIIVSLSNKEGHYQDYRTKVNQSSG